MSRQFRTLLLIGVTLAVGGGFGCFSNTGDRNGPSCSGGSYLRVQWGIDHGAGTIPISCQDASNAGYYVELDTASSSVPVTLNLSCTLNKVCSTGDPCYFYGETAAVPAGTTIVSGTLLSGGAVVETVTIPYVTVPQCDYAEAAFLFTI
jgi:hypothetical protein